MVEQLKHDVLIVGGGLAGLRAALEACKTADTAIVSKAHPLRSDSGAARGGINAAIGRDDAWERHWLDTLQSGEYLRAGAHGRALQPQARRSHRHASLWWRGSPPHLFRRRHHRPRAATDAL